MATVETNYAPGSISTVTSAPGYDTGDNSMLDFWNEMARRKRATARPQPRMQMAAAPRMPSQPEQQEKSLAQDRAERAQLAILEAKAQEAQAQARAQSGRMPTKLHPGGAGFMGAFETPDAMGMTGAQRAVFLPNNSQQLGSFNDTNPAEDDFLIRMRQARTAGRG